MSISDTILDARVIRCCQIAATVVVFYDHIICLDQEVEYIWKRKWTLSKALYVANRCLGGILLISECVLHFMSFESNQLCTALFGLQGYLNTAVIWIASTIMALRLTAMFPQSRTVRYVVSFVLIAELITMITILSVTLRHTHPDDPSLVTCFPFGVSQYFYAFYLPPLILETILFFLAVWNAIHQLRIRKIWNRNEVLSVLIRDSIFYFLISELFFAGNAALTLYVYKNGVHLGFHEGRTSWLQIPYASSAAANIILVARFTLNLQSAFYKPTLYRSEGDETMTTINWAHTADTSLPGVFEMSTSPRSRHFLDSSNSQNFSG